MPTRQQMDYVMQKIAWLKSMRYGRDAPHPPAPMPDDLIESLNNLRDDVTPPVSPSDLALPGWGDLSRGEQQAVLRAHVFWEAHGFTDAQGADVIRRVLDGKGADFWMDGIEAVKPTPGAWRMVRHGAGSDYGPNAYTLWPQGVILKNLSEADARSIEATPKMRDALDYVEMELSAFKADALKNLGLDVAMEKIRDALTAAGVDLGRPAEPSPPPGSLTAAILDHPGAFMPDPGPSIGNDHGHDNGNGPERTR